MTVQFPKRGRGRQSAAQKAEYDEQVREFCDFMLQIKSRLDFAPSSRGWCYVLEGEHVLTKGDFDAGQRLINECRKTGLLPMDICDEDGKREFENLQRLDGAVESFAQRWVTFVRDAADWYTPVSFWDDKPVYIEVLVEKSDLKSLFSPVCKKFYVPIANQGGWADLWTRYHIANRFAEHEAAGRQCVLLYCGDHDPGGLNISDNLRSNLADLSQATGWEPTNLIIDRFGLNHDFIVQNGLSWIENLETSSGERLDNPKHAHHNMPYVQSYLAEFGPRKVEANALVIRPNEGRQLCREAILRYLGDADAPLEYWKSLRPYRERARAQIAELLAA